MTDDVGQQYCSVIECFEIPAGRNAGKRFDLLPIHREFISKIFGTLDSDGLRQYRKGLLFIPKKNAKSTIAAAIVVAALFINTQRGKQIYSVALSLEQASIVFRAAKAIIEADPLLSERFEITASKKLITDNKTGSTYQALSRENKAKNGLLPSLLVCDEISDWDDGAMIDLYEKLDSGMVGAREPLTIYLTTAGVSRKSIGYEIYKHAKHVQQDPKFDPRFLPVICEAPPDADWKDLKIWEQCNPGWGITIEPTTASQMIAEAENQPSKITQILRYHLNHWVDSDHPWIPSELWEAAPHFDIAELQGRVCDVGIDLANVVDMSAVVLGFWLPEKRFALIPRFYVPKETAAERQRKDGVPYLRWIDEGYVIATDGASCDQEFIKADIRKLAEIYTIRQIACDPWNAASFMNSLDSEGFSIHQFRQGHGSYAPATKEFERLLADKRFLHSHNPVLTWHSRNVVACYDSNANVKPDKGKSSEKIDGVVAALMALGMSIINGGGQDEEALQVGGLLWLT